MKPNDERTRRAAEQPIVGGLPDFPGILAAINLTPGFALHLRGLADELLAKDYPGATLTRAERELIATSVSAGNECFYCMDTHGAFASELLRRAHTPGVEALVDGVKSGEVSNLSDKMRALLDVAHTVRRRSRDLTGEQIARALSAGATDADTQLAVLIAAAFSMYNRMVDGLRARTPADPEAYRARAIEIAEHGYSDPRTKSIPR